MDNSGSRSRKTEFVRGTIGIVNENIITRCKGPWLLWTLYAVTFGILLITPSHRSFEDVLELSIKLSHILRRVGKLWALGVPI